MGIIRPFSKRVGEIEVSAIKQMAIKAEGYNDVISFGWGVPASRSHDVIRQAVVNAFTNDPDIDKYSPVQGIPELRGKIASMWPARYGYEITPKQVLVTAGAMEGLMCLMQTLFDPGDEVMVMDPGFSSHIEQMELTGLVPKYVSLNEESGWHLNESVLRAVISDKTKGIILINPNNPTGNIFSEDDIKLIARVVKENNLWLIIDEPYTYLVYDDIDVFHPSAISSIRDNIIIVHSFSKKYSMTGWRVGYVVTPFEDIVLELMKVHDATVVSAARVSQIGALKALSIPDSEIMIERDIIERRRDLICNWLDRMPDLFSYVKPQGAYYIFPKVVSKGWDDVKLAHKILEEAQVVITPGYAFGPTGKNHVRMCFSGSEDVINEGGRRILEWWEKNRQ